jgi:hypothetical protein
MNYTVLWTSTAEEGLAALWLTEPDRPAITAAANSIDTQLNTDPDQCGESRYDTVRVLFVYPLGVEFDVQEQDRVVYVTSVWSIARRK